MALKPIKRRLRLLAAALVVLAAFAVTAARASSAPVAQSSQAAPAPTQSEYAADAIKTCLNQCHAMAPVNLILETPHAVKADARTPFAKHQCEECHGPSSKHVETPSDPAAIVFKGPKASPVAERNAKCLSCHQAGLRMHWSGSQHESRGVACSDCHTIHAADQKVLRRATQAEVCFGCHKAQRAQVRRVSAHPIAITGLANAPFMACSDCHNPHGSTGPRMLIKNSVNETCYTCHAEKRGPFLWEHSPVTDDCTNCHTPHGSTTAPLLKARVPWLCQECHSGDHGNQINSGSNLVAGAVTTVNGVQAGTVGAAPRVQMAARACVNCHVQVHGSNSPAGSKFQR